LSRWRATKSKRIGVKPGNCLSLQTYRHLEKHWIKVKGTAETTRSKKTVLLTEIQSTHIPVREVHRLHNPGKLELEMIEVQSGIYLDQKDLVRLEDTYGRAS
jgi:mannose-1-phosphate guanylyltransferase/mannose-6-phosphate isomerase